MSRRGRPVSVAPVRTLRVKLGAEDSDALKRIAEAWGCTESEAIRRMIAAQ